MTQNFRNRLANVRNKFVDALLGQQMPVTDDIDMLEDAKLLKGVDVSSPEYKENRGLYENEYDPLAAISISNPQRKGGILPDLARGYQENYATGFAAPNWGDNQLNDGRNKGFAYRLGEGLGSVGRFIDSPLGRGLIAGGLNAALGYDNSLQEGLTAAVGRQNAQTADRIYRQQLKQMGYSDEDLAGLNGNITTDMYKGLTSGFRLGNQRMTYGQLAMFDEGVAEQVKQNPELANQFIPMTFAKDIYGKKRDLAENKINVDAKKLEQNERRLNILQQKVNQGAATQAEMSELRQLKIEQTKLENALYQRELGGGNQGGTTRPVGQTKSGIKYKVVD